jgi:hypothetical protein
LNLRGSAASDERSDIILESSERDQVTVGLQKIVSLVEMDVMIVAIPRYIRIVCSRSPPPRLLLKDHPYS